MRISNQWPCKDRIFNDILHKDTYFGLFIYHWCYRLQMQQERPCFNLIFTRHILVWKKIFWLKISSQTGPRLICFFLQKWVQQQLVTICIMMTVSFFLLLRGIDFSNQYAICMGLATIEMKLHSVWLGPTDKAQVIFQLGSRKHCSRYKNSHIFDMRTLLLVITWSQLLFRISDQYSKPIDPWH